ncbi:hypothetical protein VE02_08278 [Pseudogymnoascus sp. 03VT05]|nr:hypothetical protein VE02_08278 [Pseudogymnoascus sp. 03VT05]
MSSALERTVKILGTLFPSIPLDSLDSLSQEQLVALISSTTKFEDREAVLAEDNDDSFKCLELSPETYFSWDESMRSQDSTQRISDDVNGLSLTLDSKSSFLGISSISTILRAMAHIVPDFRNSIKKYQASVVEDKTGKCPKQTIIQYDEAYFINAYFAHIHCVTPIVDEEEFRSKYARGGDKQSPWLALLNMVLAIGSISTSEPDETSHKTFYEKAYQNLGLDSMGNGHLETIQALGLLGGYYCHYLNQPNMANVIMGAALRMAVAMGLHREPVYRVTEPSGLNIFVLHEIRRRVWWCLFCLDTWASLTLGRPSLGRWDKTTTTANLPSSSDFAGNSLRSSVEFCKIATALQDRLARHPLMSCKEIMEFDGHVVKWQSNLPPILQSSHPCRSDLRMARGLINARYQNLRLVLYRPRLLTTTVHRASFHSDLSSEEQAVVQRCRSIASEIISSVQKDWFSVQQVVRNSIWFMFNACMVPLLSLLSDPSHKDAEIWRMDVETSLSLCEELSSWSPVIERSREAIYAIYEVSNNSKAVGPPSGLESDSSFFWGSLDADTFWNDIGLESLLGSSNFEFEPSIFSKTNY